MIAKAIQPTLDDIARSLDVMNIRIAGLVTKESFDSAIDDLVTKKDFDTSIARLETTIRREAGDLGESIASLTDMVTKEFDGLTITRSTRG